VQLSKGWYWSEEKQEPEAWQFPLLDSIVTIGALLVKIGLVRVVVTNNNFMARSG